MSDTPTLILASGSAVRANLLKGARIPFEKKPADLDESILKRELENDPAAQGEHGAGPAIAVALAKAKAELVSRENPDALVIGADQVMTLGTTCYDKPKDMAEAKARLRDFRGKPHVLHGGVALARGGETIWHHYQPSHLTMRDFSDAFLDHYLEEAGEAVLSSVGAYQLESIGAQLFDRIDGDYFAILGLPLLPLMAELRRLGALRD
ncbi:Maf family nucleotide pyrophosphatase [Pyruvatibacter mobilis]|uniref:Maf family nucleotide pyrophosphatase n=1 Tax=Pyruvatibacter mobilis TaxID=1712261 RepID=UPI003D09C40A